LIEHDENNIGFNSDMAYCPEDRLALIVLANLNGTCYGRDDEGACGDAHGQTPPIPSVHKEIALAKEVLASKSQD
jgi:hypothetical protein